MSWASSPAVRRQMIGNKGRDTKPELALRSAVHRLGLRYRVAAPPIRGLRRSADMIFRRARVAVFVDGCFWHGCPQHYAAPATNAGYWAAKVTRNSARDRDTDARLADAGWVVIRVWEHEPPEPVAAVVANTVRRRLAALS